MEAAGRGHVGSVGAANAGELWAVKELCGLLGQLGEAGECGQAVGGDILGSVVVRVCGEEGKAVEMSVAGRAVVGAEVFCSEDRFIQVFRTRGVALALGLEG